MHAAARLVHERVDDLVGKPVRVRRERRRRDDAHHLPVTRRRVLPLRALDEPSGDRRRARLRRAALERHDVPEPERLEIGQVEASDRAGRVAEGVRAFVSVLPCVRQLTSADGVEHDYARSRHGAILRRLWTTPSAFCSSSCTSSDPRDLAAGITYAVIKLFPTERKPKNPDKQDVLRIRRTRTPAASSSAGRSARRRSSHARRRSARRPPTAATSAARTRRPVDRRSDSSRRTCACRPEARSPR